MDYKIDEKSTLKNERSGADYLCKMQDLFKLVFLSLAP